MANLLQIVLLVAATMAAAKASDVLVGVYYGLQGDNLPPPPSVVQLCKEYNIKRIRFSEPDIDILEAFRGAGVEISFGISNSDLFEMSMNSTAINTWFQTYVKPFIGDFVFNYIVVGDKVIPGLDDIILPVMKDLQRIINNHDLGQVKLTTLVGYQSALDVKHPPSAGAFTPTAIDNVRQILDFLAQEGSPLMVSVFPYRRYAHYQQNMSLSYAQFESPVAVQDGPLSYWNWLDEMLDAFYAAIEKENVQDLTVIVGETGWPRCGNGNKTTVELAENYNRRFIEHISSGKGTPRNPGVYIEGFIQSLFSEDLMPEGDSRCYGIFKVSLDPAYQLFSKTN